MQLSFLLVTSQVARKSSRLKQELCRATLLLKSPEMLSYVARKCMENFYYFKRYWDETREMDV